MSRPGPVGATWSRPRPGEGDGAEKHREIGEGGRPGDETEDSVALRSTEYVKLPYGTPVATA